MRPRDTISTHFSWLPCCFVNGNFVAAVGARLSIEHRERNPRNLTQGAAVRLEPRHSPHALDRCDKEFRQRARIALRSKLAAALPASQRIGKNGFNLCLVVL